MRNILLFGGIAKRGLGTDIDLAIVVSQVDYYIWTKKFFQSYDAAFYESPFAKPRIFRYQACQHIGVNMSPIGFFRNNFGSLKNFSEHDLDILILPINWQDRKLEIALNYRESTGLINDIESDGIHMI